MRRIFVLLAILQLIALPAFAQEEIDETIETIEDTAVEVDETAETVEETAVEVDESSDSVEDALVQVEPIGDTAVDVSDSNNDDGDSSGSDLGNIVLGIHIGPSLSVFSDLGVHVMPRLEIGYNLPPVGRRLEVFLTGSYTRPPTDGEVTDSRLPNSGSFTYEATEDELTIGLGILARVFELGEFINPYATFGPQVVLLKTTVNGEAAGAAFGENTETATQFGIFGSLGVEMVAGPGAAFFQLGVSWSDLAGTITGDSNTGNLTPALGYRLML